MSTEKQTEEKKEKVMTRYDRKMEKRRVEAEKERKSWIRFKVISLLIVAAVAVAVIFSAASSAYRRYDALNKTYVKIGEHELTRLEYDYYYSNAVNSYVSMYGSYVSMMGLDPNTDFAGQTYPGNENMTWKDYFDQLTVTQIQQVKAMVDDAAAKGFEYDDTEDMAAYDADFKAQAEAAGAEAGIYYSALYGEYATESRIKPFVRENLLAAAYYEHMIEENQPADEEITAYYEENKIMYDTVDYRSFTFTADLAEDATDEDKAAAMKELKAQAEEMKERRLAGEDFEALCAEYAPEDQKENYGGETEGSLVEGGSYYMIPVSLSEWMYDESRKEGDIIAVEDTASNRYYVAEFVARSNDEEATRTSIGNMMADEVVSEYTAELALKYEVTDVAGELKYLTIPEETETAGTETAETASGTEEAETEAAAETTLENAAETETASEAVSETPEESVTEEGETEESTASAETEASAETGTVTEAAAE